MKQKHVGGERIVAKLVVGPCEKFDFWRLSFNAKFSGNMAEAVIWPKCGMSLKKVKID